MSFLDLAKSRYTTKKFDSRKKISEDKIAQLKEILRLSPSSIDSQPWKFVFVSDHKVKKELAGASFFNEHKVNDASHLVVFYVLDDLQVFEERIVQNYPEGAVAYYKNNIKARSEADIKNWMAHQVYLSLGFFLSACASIGIDSTPMEGINLQEYTRILPLNAYRPLFAVALGYRSDEDSNQPSITPKSRLRLEDVIQSV